MSEEINLRRGGRSIISPTASGSSRAVLFELGPIAHCTFYDEELKKMICTYHRLHLYSCTKKYWQYMYIYIYRLAVNQGHPRYSTFLSHFYVTLTNKDSFSLFYQILLLLSNYFTGTYIIFDWLFFLFIYSFAYLNYKTVVYWDLCRFELK